MDDHGSKAIVFTGVCEACGELMADQGPRHRGCPMLTVAHVRSWLTAHPEAKIGTSGDWELPRRPDAETVDALRCIIRDTLEGAKVNDAAIVTAIIVADLVDNFDVKLKDYEETARAEVAR